MTETADFKVLEIILVTIVVVGFVVFLLFTKQWMARRIRNYFTARRIKKNRKKNPCYHCPSVRNHHCNGCFWGDLMEFEASEERSDEK